MLSGNYSKPFMSPYNIIVHPKNSLFSTSNVMNLAPNTSEDFIIDQETMDKTSVAKIEGCEPDEDYSEDNCLQDCMAEKFVEEFGCLNANLKRNVRIKEKYTNTNVCGSKVNWNVLISASLRLL